MTSLPRALARDDAETARPAPAPPAAAGGRVDATAPDFRERAMRAQLREESPAPLLAVAPPSAWGVLVALGGLVLAAALFSVVGRIEVTARGRGALRAAGGALPIEAEVAGVVAEVSVRSGDRVRAGQVLTRLEAASLKGALLEAERQLAFVKRNAAASASRRQVLSRERKRLLESRIALAEQRISAQEDATGRLERRRQDLATLESSGYLGRHQVEDIDDQRAAAARQILALRQEVADAQAQLAALAAEREAEDIALAQEREQAQARRDAAALLVAGTLITAPRDGVIDALLVHPGEVISAGAPVGRLVPANTPTELMAFIDEKDRAFLRRGATVKVELDQLPVGEFGAVEGVVRRVGEDLASSSELRDVLGETAPVGRAQYRVEIELDARQRTSQLALRPGMLATVRYSLRRRRIIGLVFTALHERFE